jgi:DNA repair exonuclease SbcCD ATPase subunit
MSPKFGFFKRKTSNYFQDKKKDSDSVPSVTDKELLEIIENEKKAFEKDLSSNLEPIRNSVLDCLDRLRKGADELEEQEIKVENHQFESLINTSKKILITSIKKESLIESSEIKNYEDAVKFKNNLELLINRFGQVGDSHNRILNEFMRKQVNKFKNEFDNLSSLLKKVTKLLSTKENEINKCIACKEDLILFKEKLSERNDKQDRLSELMKERQTIDKNIDMGNKEFEQFQKSEEFLNSSKVLEKINDKKNEIRIFEKNMINRVSNLSRPITKFSYQASKETQGRLATILNEPLEIFNDSSQYLLLFNELKKQVLEKSIQIKDPEKTIHQIDEIINSVPSLASNLKNLNEQLIQLESTVNSKNMKHLDDIKNKTKMYEKYHSENISSIEEIKNTIDELDSASKMLKNKIEDSVLDITNTRYSVLIS